MAAYDETLARPRRSDIQQSVLFGLGLLCVQGPRQTIHKRLVLHSIHGSRRTNLIHQVDGLGPLRAAARGIRQHHQIEFQTLGLVNRHQLQRPALSRWSFALPGTHLAQHSQVLQKRVHVHQLTDLCIVHQLVQIAPQSAVRAGHHRAPIQAIYEQADQLRHRKPIRQQMHLLQNLLGPRGRPQVLPIQDSGGLRQRGSQRAFF